MGNRVPPVYNTPATYVTIYASFLAKGAQVSSGILPGGIHWTYTNLRDFRGPSPGTPTITLTPSNDEHSCVVQLGGCQGGVSADVTCQYNNNDDTVVSNTITINFIGNLYKFVDTINLTPSG